MESQHGAGTGPSHLKKAVQPDRSVQTYSTRSSAKVINQHVTITIITTLINYVVPKKHETNAVNRVVSLPIPEPDLRLKLVVLNGKKDRRKEQSL